ncbi:MAG TPA: FkbM family methyltransferase, partial [Puia sp.]
GSYQSYKQQPTYQKARGLFAGFHTRVTKEQQDFVNYELGIGNSISRMKAAGLLYKAFIKFYLIPKFKKGGRSMISKLPGLNTGFKYLKNAALLRLKKDEHAHLLKNKFLSLRELVRLKYTNQEDSCLMGRKMLITDSFWYLHSLKEIFVDEVYRFRSFSEKPYILDCGTNIGLSIIYFKRLFPKARIVAFEPDFSIYNKLIRNLETFEIGDVDVQCKAVWVKEEMLNFAVTGSLGGRLSDHSAETTIQVQATRLRDYINEPVDFLKIDIEGAEFEVLTDCANLLHNVKHLFVEYHSLPDKGQDLDRLLSILNEAGFRVYIKEAWNNMNNPFLHEDYRPTYDLQLNIFGYRVSK